MQYYSFEELKKLVGKNLEFETFFGHTKKGVLEIEGKKLWLPFCGGVDATTVKIKSF
jgi:hypothetical protein